MKASPYVFPGLSPSAKYQIKTHTCFNRGELDIIAGSCCDQYDLTLNEFRGRSKTNPLSDARKIFFYLCRVDLYKFTCKRLGMYAGNRDHSTVTFAVQRAKELMQVDPEFRVKYMRAKTGARQMLKLNGYQYKGSEKLTNYDKRDQRVPSLASRDYGEGSTYAAQTVGELNCEVQ